MSAVPGEHRFGVRSLNSESSARIARNAARTLASDNTPPELVDLQGFCSCGHSDCEFAWAYVAGVDFGLRTGAVIATAHGAPDALRTLAANPSALPRELNVRLTLPEGVTLAMPTAPDVEVLDANDNVVSRTRRRS